VHPHQIFGTPCIGNWCAGSHRKCPCTYSLSSCDSRAAYCAWTPQRKLGTAVHP